MVFWLHRIFDYRRMLSFFNRHMAYLRKTGNMEYVFGSGYFFSAHLEYLYRIGSLACYPDMQTQYIPKLELKDGIPEEYRSMVVIPTLLTDEKELWNWWSKWKSSTWPIRRNLHFALIGDYKDGPNEHEEKDESIINAGRRLIGELNNKYDRQDIFYFFHRHRQWNRSQSSWMGWERKRGALTEFNALLTGSKNTSFSVQVGDLSILDKIKYVITLDAYTQLPRDNAKS